MLTRNLLFFFNIDEYHQNGLNGKQGY